MKTTRFIRSTLLIAALVSIVSACDQPQSGASAGKKLGETASDASRKIGEVMNRVDSKLTEEAPKAAAVLDDLEITARVKAAIFAEPGLKTLQIGVNTDKRVVALSGSVDTAADRELAVSLAGAVAGVKQVNDRLVVKPAKATGAQ